MKSRTLTLLTCIVLVASMFGGPSLTNVALAASQPKAAAVSPAELLTPAALAPVQPLSPDANILDIPTAGGPIVVDGSCDTSGEYGKAQVETFIDGNGKLATVYLIANADMLFVCMHAQQGAFPTRFGRVYLDPQGDGSNYVFANQGDDAFQVNIPGQNRSSYIGNSNPNGWTLTPGLDGFWSGIATTSADATETVEYGLQRGALGFGNNCSVFGLSVFHNSFNAVGDDYSWPVGSIFDQPRTWQLARIPSGNCPSSDIAYVYRGNTNDATSFYNLLTSKGYGVDLIPLGSVLTTDFSVYKMIIVADDTGSLNQWGSSGLTAAQVAKIADPAPGKPVKPIIGLGEGGYAFFGQLSMFIGWPHGWHGPQNAINRSGPASAPYFLGVSTLTDPVPHYLTPTNSVGIYTALPPVGVTFLGLEDPTVDHASLSYESCRWLWGNSGNPLGMTADGQIIFLNTVKEAHAFQCDPAPTPPPDVCYKVEKTVVPTTDVTPGSLLTYKLTYTFTAGTNCPTSAKLVDVVPAGTTYVPGSADGGISPAADGSLTWLVGAADPLPHTRSFQVIVSDSACTANHQVTNFAEMRVSGFPPKLSPPVTNGVTCPPVGLPNHEPVFAETELKASPYSLRIGQLTQVSVRVENLNPTPQAVTVQFKTSPAQFGIGLAYTNLIGSAAATLPASGQAVLSTSFVSTVAGNTCIQAEITAPGMASPLITQSCLDVTEVLTPGEAATLIVPVRNNTTHNPAAIILVVDNTCPGWSAVVTNPASATLSLATGASSNVTMTVTPPATGPLGSGCHIDLQAWDTTDPAHPVLIGGVRKLDVPPVHLPLNVQPSWEEPEITFNPDPPVAGVPGQLCIQLANPLAVSKTVTIDFAVADFGAGIGFVPAASMTVNLPPNSLATYCTSWTPLATGTLHRCVLATLSQPGYLPQHSQHNVDIVRPSTTLAGNPTFPFTAGNPDLTPHTLGFAFNLVGINPVWMPIVEPLGGGILPGTIGSGEQLNLQLVLSQMILAPNPIIPGSPLDLTLGSVHSVEVTLLLDGLPSGGFSVQLVPNQVYLPAVRR